MVRAIGDIEGTRKQRDRYREAAERWEQMYHRMADLRDESVKRERRYRETLEAYWPMVVEQDDEAGWEKMVRDALDPKRDECPTCGSAFRPTGREAVAIPDEPCPDPWHALDRDCTCLPLGVENRCPVHGSHPDPERD